MIVEESKIDNIGKQLDIWHINDALSGHKSLIDCPWKKRERERPKEEMNEMKRYTNRNDDSQRENK